MMKSLAFFLHPGYIFASEEPHWVHTLLGSCVSVCLWDGDKQVGGVNHHVLPRQQGHPTARYGDVAIPHLIATVMAMGAKSSTLRAHIVGGGHHDLLDDRVAFLNVEIAQQILASYHIPTTSLDVGGCIHRRVTFHTGTGEIHIGRTTFRNGVDTLATNQNTNR